MRSWFALVLAPLAALGVQGVMYALVTPSCANQSSAGLHASAAIALAFAAVLAFLASTDWKRHGEPATPDDDAGGPRATRRFLAIVATAVAAISCLVIAAMWLGVWVLSPCSPWP